MATLYQQIGEKFLSRLAEEETVSPEKIVQLRTLLADCKKVKAEDFIKIFSEPDAGEIT